MSYICQHQRAPTTMNKKEYADYQTTVKNFFEHEGINCLNSDSEDYDEFSWHECDCCGTTLGGARYPASGYNPDTKTVEYYSVCTDCLYYTECGQLDDDTMTNLEETA